jgi:hypothetical protein
MPVLNTNEDDLYQLVIEYTSGDIQFTDPSNEYIGLKNLELSFEKCTGNFLICIPFNSVQGKNQFI